MAIYLPLETDTAAPAGTIAACTALTAATTQVSALASMGGVLGTTSKAITLASSGVNTRATYLEFVPGVTSWAAGNYVVRLNCTTANANITWASTSICRLNSSNVSQATIGTLTGQTTSLGTTGVKTHTISGSLQTAATTDKVYIVCGFTNAQAMANSANFTFNQMIDTPIVLTESPPPSLTVPKWGST